MKDNTQKELLKMYQFLM